MHKKILKSEWLSLLRKRDARALAQLICDIYVDKSQRVKSKH
jgi:hypothetical protein